MSALNSRTGIHYAFEPIVADAAGTFASKSKATVASGASDALSLVYRPAETLISGGDYFITARFNDDEQSELYVDGAAFTIAVPVPRPEAYLTHGPQKSDPSLYSKLGAYPEPDGASKDGGLPGAKAEVATINQEQPGYARDSTV